MCRSRKAVIGRYRLGPQEMRAQREQISVGGRTGYLWRQPQACEVAAPSGDSDFITWTVDTTAAPARDVCALAHSLRRH
ncbi:hypothetical protein [Nocardia sp. N2S4-5]|uniref:hypothetical protein n=1 Tax=Nocardia sp. N2S4-5 TaxID=3351565 RepID=UPI0037D7477F